MPPDFLSKQNQNLAERFANEALLAANQKSLPVHINWPIREPFYLEESKPFKTSPRIIHGLKTDPQVDPVFLVDLVKTLKDSKNTWLIIGETQESLPLEELEVLVERFQMQCFIDPLSNVHLKNQYRFFNDWLGSEEVEKPDLIISTGKHFLSKSLKTFVRNCSVQHHLHVQDVEGIHDPFQSFTHVLELPFSKLVTAVHAATKSLSSKKLNTKYNRFEEQAAIKRNTQIQQDRELSAASSIIQALPNEAVLHLGNSTPVRYSLWAGEILAKKQIEIYANRGTSGIDGSVSTAVAMAQEDNRAHFLLLGDLSMFYDRNGLWHKYVPANFKILVMNNRGGGIFGRITGPKSQAEFQEYFMNTQPTDFQSLAQTHGFQYHLVEAPNNLQALLSEDGKLLLEFKI